MKKKPPQSARRVREQETKGVLLVAFGFGLSLALCGCSADRVCEPGTLQYCPCLDRTDGLQECADDGSGWRPCECSESDPSATSTSVESVPMTEGSAEDKPMETPPQRLDGMWRGGDESCDVVYLFDSGQGRRYVDCWGSSVVFSANYAQLDENALTFTSFRIETATGFFARLPTEVPGGEVFTYTFDDAGHLVSFDSEGSVIFERIHLTVAEGHSWLDGVVEDLGVTTLEGVVEDLGVTAHCGNPDHNPGVANWGEYVCQAGREADGCLTFARYTSHVRNSCPGQHSLCCPPSAPVVEPEPRDNESEEGAPDEPIQIGLVERSFSEGGPGPLFPMGNSQVGRPPTVTAEPSTQLPHPTDGDQTISGDDETRGREVQEDDREHPEVRREISADYPDSARRHGIEADVVAMVDVDENGSVGSVEVISCSAPGLGFEMAAVEALERFEFSPAVFNGAPVESRIRYRYRFRLD